MLLCMPLTFVCAREGEDFLEQLDKCLKIRSLYSQQKEIRIDSVKRLITEAETDSALFIAYNKVYYEYYTYSFDSAMVYVNRQSEIAGRLKNPLLQDLCMVHRSQLLTTSGYFSESVENLKSLDSKKMERSVLQEYYSACERAYGTWGEYLSDDVFAPRYNKQETLYADSLINAYPKGSLMYLHYKASICLRKKQYVKAEEILKKLLDSVSHSERLFSMTAYDLASIYRVRKDWARYEEFLICAAIFDQVSATKENLALQELALYLKEHYNDQDKRANRYLAVAMEDAQFYNNRLRMLQIARKFPSIVLSYQKEVEQKNTRLEWALIGITVLMLSLAISMFIIYRANQIIRKRRQIVSQMNNELSIMNLKLQETNTTREQYVSLFMDLCAAYIEKLNRYQALVKRKVKAKQTDDLTKMINVTHLSETDAKEFFLNFDTAFLTLYPHFIEEFNVLLRDGEEIIPKRGEVLNTDLRIFALIRMGVNDSSKIATLLFYSPQTIYNRRSVVKNKAKSRDDFELQVEKLCSVNL